MPNGLLPAFQRFPEEASVIGRLLAGYGELEYAFALCLAQVLDAKDPGPALKAFFRLRGEASKLDMADALMTAACTNEGFGEAYGEAKGAMRYCLKIRNQFAHCHWGDGKDGLFFTNLEEAAGAAEGMPMKWCHVDATLLRKQEAYFSYTAACIWHVRNAFRIKNGELKSLLFARPPKLQQPNRYNPPKRDTPPWQA
jgi:hypothetical protein